MTGSAVAVWLVAGLFAAIAMFWLRTVARVSRRFYVVALVASVSLALLLAALVLAARSWQAAVPAGLFAFTFIASTCWNAAAIVAYVDKQRHTPSPPR